MSDCYASPNATDEHGASEPAMPGFALRPGVVVPDWSVVASPRAREVLHTLLQTAHLIRRWSGYSAEADRVRTAVLKLYAETGRAPAVEAVAARSGMSVTAVQTLLDELGARDLVVLDGRRMIGAYPFTDADSGHRVTWHGQATNAMCAIDALGIGAMLEHETAISSRCRHCGASIRVETQDDGRRLALAEPEAAVVWLSARYEGCCAATSLCRETAFFCSDAHLDAWRLQSRSDVAGWRLTMDEALQVGRAIFGPSLARLETVERKGLVQPVKSNRRKHDIVVIGAGSAGFSAAITAAEQGANVALIGHGTLGGTCVNIGCVPSKTLIRALESVHRARSAARFAGIRAEGRVTDWAALVAQKDELVAGLRRAKYADLLRAYNGIAYLEGPARLSEDGVVVNGSLIKTPKVIIATGARPAVPEIAGIETVDYLTSTSALGLEALPKSLLVVGGGFVGAELAQLFARAGVAVTIVCRSRLLPRAEPEISEALSHHFRGEGITLACGVAYGTCRKREAGVELSVLENGQRRTLIAERLLIATGRSPNVEQLGLAEAGVRQGRGGAIEVDDRMRTSRPGTYAAGDVTGRDQFVYMAAYGAKLAAKNALNGDRLVYDNRAMPTVVFTDPQVASVGFTEVQAKAEGHEVVTSMLSLDNVPRAIAARDTRGLIKLVADANNGKLLGAHLLAPEGADSIQTAALAIKAGMTVEQVAETIFPYLTLVEGLKLAALAFSKDVKMLSCCAG
jgi:mercury(II) reductase